MGRGGARWASDGKNDKIKGRPGGGPRLIGFESKEGAMFLSTRGLCAAALGSTIVLMVAAGALAHPDQHGSPDGHLAGAGA